MFPAGFDYHAPNSLAEAVQLMGNLGPDAKVLAGGHSLLPMMKLRFAQPSHLVDLRRIAELRGIRQVGDEIHIGAMTTEHELLHSPLLADKVPLLVEGAGWIADPQVRYKGTIGGDISHGDPGNDHPALMLALDASFVLRGAQGERTVKADGFFLGVYSTQLEPGEILTQVRVPIPAPGTGWSYQKLKRKTGDFATAAAAVLLQMKGGNVATVSIALTNAGPTALKASGAEASLLGKPLDEAALDEAARQAMAICEPTPDLRGDVAYKVAMAGEMTRRALQAAHARTGQA
ncbi:MULTISPECIES: FAD binding domain-containing protein [Ramlibacter]|uniref:Xanthine dehydrogenase family protein subunit M n=1 Tax=Ramlibacter pinisoli TaxID=2682844 RepID=A0A6N8IYI0_9BURK|nr:MULTISPECIES: xanthine dehydrogenase family protein subunit M [Ramlibacter]MBA2961702.1 xanthine dehydrogenase family protein subunit M [Ramlibacter sp. CGMCC 1.13660]MVQ31645.1 xanthine dehydrogenase family protein subunit M [Ramlibacter pinisoli]